MKRANDIGHHVAKLRRMRGWTQEIMAAKLQCLGGKGYDMTEAIIANIESGRKNVYHWQIRAIHDVFGCSYDEIFLGPKMIGAPSGALLKKSHERRHAHCPK